ncbi:MAG: sugar ABC transporter permease [Actinomycetota bacterium]
MSEAAPGAPRSGRRWRDTGLAAAMLAPSALLLGAFVVYPLIRAVDLGRQRCNARGDRCIDTGWDQYADVFRSSEFQEALRVTAQFALISVPLGLVLGVGLAVLADKYLRGMAIFRTVFASTIATSVAVASLMWLFLLQPSVGTLANAGWFEALFPSVKNPGWLNDSGTALIAVALSSVWAGLGFTFVLVSASLQSIPDELHEAAAVDGASGTMRFWRITVPMLGPTLVFVVVVLTARAFQTFGEVDLLTDGGPAPGDSTTTLAYLVYGDTLLKDDAGLRATGAVLLFVVLLVLSAIQVRGLGRRSTLRGANS